MAENSVESYNTTGPSLLHQGFMVQLLKEGLAEELGDYTRSLCGSMSEKSSSTIEIPDIDINAMFHLNSDYIKITSGRYDSMRGLLFRIFVVETKKNDVLKLVLKMRYHGIKDELQQNYLAKSYPFHGPNSLQGPYRGPFVNSNVARWQLVGVIKAMQAWGLEVPQSSRKAANDGPSNAHNEEIYDSAVCRRGILKRGRFEKVLKVMLENKPCALSPEHQ